jgi:hypothetical protein
VLILATVNKRVYGAKDNWYVPSEHLEFGTTQYADVFYYNQIAADDKLKIKIANYNTLESPVTTMISQMDGQYTSESYLIKNKWKPTEFTMDNSIVQFGIGSQSGLSNQEWWYVDREYGASNPSPDTPPVLKNTDKYDITNMCFATRSNYTPYEFYTAGRGSILGGYDNNYMYWQRISRQIFGTINSMFSPEYSSQWGYETGYVNTKLVTQIPIKNLKLTPVIYAYNTALDNYKKFTSIRDYLTDKSAYPYIFCIKAKFMYRSGFDSDTKYDYTFDCYPWFFNQTSFLKDYGATFDGQDIVYEDVYYPNRGDQGTNEGITVAGRPGYAHGPNGSMLGNEIYWYGHYDSSTTWHYTIGQGGRVLQTPDFKFVLGTKNLFYCDTSSMTNDQITGGIRTQLASFGMFFVDDVDDLNLALDDDKTFLGILENGVGYGKYSNGKKNREQDQWNWDTMDKNDYDPVNPIPIDPNTYNGSMGTGLVLSFPTATTRYNIRTNDFITLTDKLWDAMALATPDNIANYSLDTFLTSNPIDSIVNIKWFPIKESMSIGTSVKVKLGKYDTGISAYAAQTSILKDCGNVVIYPVSGRGVANWIDKLTKITLYLPFCGSLNLDPETYMGRSVNVEYAIDLITGSCSAYVSYIADNGQRVITDIASGTCGIDCPVTGIQHTTLDSQLYNATEQLKAMRVNNAINGLTSVLGLSDVTNKGMSGISDALKTGGTIYNALQNESVAEYNLHHTQTPIKMIGTSSAMTGAMCELRPTIIFERPVIPPIDDSAYAHVCGYACCEPTTIGNLSGYAEFASADLSGFDATAEEKNMIANALMGGVYL